MSQHRTRSKQVPRGFSSSLLLSLVTTAILGVGFFAHSDARAAPPASSPDGTTVLPGDGGLPLMEQFSSVNVAVASKAKHLANIGNKGEMSHSIPIVLPPGLLKPALSFDYAAGAKTSLDMGYYGWSLGGLMSIQLASEPAYKNGTTFYRISGPWNGILTYKDTVSSKDRYVLVTASASQYVLATLDPTLDEWTVASNAVTHTLGRAGDGTHPGWRIQKSVDAFGNQVDYNYFSGGRLNWIKYGGTSTIAHNIQIDFIYGNLYDDIAKAPRVYADGKYDLHDKKLVRVEIGIDLKGTGSFPRANAYTFVSTVLAGVGVQVLSNITREGTSSGQSQKLGSFTYQDLNILSTGFSYTSKSFNLGISGTNQFRRGAFDPTPKSRSLVGSTLIDVNCDGMRDRVTGGDTGYSLDPTNLPLTPSRTWSYSILKTELTVSNPGPATSFVWSAPRATDSGPEAGINEVIVENGFQQNQLRTVSQIADVDGDGSPDLAISKGTGTWDIYWGRCLAGAGALFGGLPDSVASPKNYSQSAESYIAKNYPVGWTNSLPSTTWGLRDMDGDGWLDIFASGKYYRKIPSRTSGWETTLTGATAPVTILSGTKLYIVSDPVEPLRHPNAVDIDGKVTQTSMETTGWYDLNGDRLPDAVEASSSTNWLVWFNKGDGSYETSATLWPTPLAGTQITDQGYPLTQYVVDFADPQPTLTYNGSPSAQLQGLLDIDGDDLLDLVTVGRLGRHWWRNIGSGFEKNSRGLAAWYPDHLKMNTLAPSASSFDTSNPNSNQAYLTHSNSYEVGGFQDLDANGRVDAVDRITATFGANNWPLLMLTVKNEAGLETGVSYTSSAHMNPAGILPGTPGMIPQTMASGHRPIVRSVTTVEDNTKQTGTSSYRFSGGVMSGGIFEGFRYLALVESLNSVTTSLEDKTFWLTRDHQPQVSDSETKSDRNLCFAPGIGGAGCVASFDRRQILSRSFHTYGHQDQFLLPSRTTVTEYGEEAGSLPKAREYNYGYDAFGNLITFVFDGAGTPALAKSLAVNYAKNTAETIFKPATLFVTGGTPPVVLEERQFYYDSHANVTDALTLGFLTKSRQCLSSQFPSTNACGEWAEWRMEKDARGQVKKTTFPTNRWVQNTYGYNGSVLTSITNNLGYLTTYTPDRKGRITDTTQVDGLKYRYLFDELDRRVETHIKDTAAGAIYKPLSRTTYDQDTIPHWVKTTELDELGVDKREETQDYDGMGNVIRIWKTVPGSSSAYQRQDFLYALNGKMIKSSHATTSSILNSQDHLDFTKTLYEGYLDWQGEARETHTDKHKGLGQVLFPQAQTWEKKTEDALGYTKRRVLNPLGLPIQVYETKTGTAETKTADYEFDALGKVTKLTFPNTNAYGYVYDTAGRLRTVSTGTGGIANNIWQTYLYNGIRYHKRTDSAGLWHEVPITGGYDGLDRVIKFNVSDIGTTTATYTAVYNDLASTGTARGKLASIKDPAAGGTGGQSFLYDTFGRLKSTTRKWLAGATPKIFQYTYDFQGRLKDETFPSGTVVSHAYEQGLETSLRIVPNGGGAPYNIFKEYDDALGLLSQVNAPVTELIVDFERTFSPTRIETHKYEIDSIMNRRDFTWATNGQLDAVNYSGTYMVNHAFAYDSLSRLLTFKVGPVTKASYAYNSSGDVTQAFSLTPSAGTYNYVHSSDTKGVIKPLSRSKAGTTEAFLYDLAHRLISWSTKGEPPRTFSYDGLGRIREAKLGGVTKQSFLYDFNGALVETQVVNGALKQYVQQFLKWNKDQTVSPAKETETLHAVLDVENGVRHWKLTELFGGDVSREYLTLPSSQPVKPGRPIWSRMLNSSAETIPGLGTTGTPDDRESFHGGQRFGTPTGIDLVHLGARVLTRKDGYWAQPEPILWLGVPASILNSPQSLHPFRYAGNNPIMMNDPTGFVSDALTPNDAPIAPDEPLVGERGDRLSELFGDDASAAAPQEVDDFVRPIVEEASGTHSHVQDDWWNRSFGRVTPQGPYGTVSIGLSGAGGWIIGFMEGVGVYHDIACAICPGDWTKNWYLYSAAGGRQGPWYGYGASVDFGYSRHASFLGTSRGVGAELELGGSVSATLNIDRSAQPLAFPLLSNVKATGWQLGLGLGIPSGGVFQHLSQINKIPYSSIQPYIPQWTTSP